MLTQCEKGVNVLIWSVKKKKRREILDGCDRQEVTKNDVISEAALSTEYICNSTEI